MNRRKSQRQAVAEALWIDVADIDEYQPGAHGKIKVFTDGNCYYIAVLDDGEVAAPVVRGFATATWVSSGTAIGATHACYRHDPRLSATR